MTDFTPRRDVQAISHVNVVVDDIEVATEFYGTVLGFEQATNADGPMDYPGVDLASFDAGLSHRREFIMLLGGAATAWPLAARGQQPAPNAVRIGWLKIQGPRHTPDQLQAFREGMRALGLVEGRDY